MDFVGAQEAADARSAAREEERRAERMCNNIADAVAERLSRPKPVKIFTSAEIRQLDFERRIRETEERRSQARHKRHLYAQVPSLRHLVK